MRLLRPLAKTINCEVRMRREYERGGRWGLKITRLLITGRGIDADVNPPIQLYNSERGLVVALKFGTVTVETATVVVTIKEDRPIWIVRVVEVQA